MDTALAASTAVKDRYSQAAQAQEAALCCPVDYDPRYLEVIPEEVIARDYGCGDPSKHLKPGETVLDLGSGTGKICFIASQVVGPTGRVIGVDMTPEMLQVARDAAPIVAQRLNAQHGITNGGPSFGNVEFRRGHIQDLALDLDRFDETLAARPIENAADYFAAGAVADALRRDAPMIADDSVDVVVSNCVLNLVASTEKAKLFAEIYRVLKRGGRAVISDIVSDEPVPAAMQDDPALWSGCISGALTESGFLQAFEDAGFHGVRVVEWQSEPWRTVEGIEFRSLTIEAYKGKEGPCWERNQGVVYLGPFKEVLDDDGHRMQRGQRYAVCDKTYQLYRQAPYAEQFALIEPRASIDLDDAQPFDCSRTALRDPRETKGLDYDATTEASGPTCAPDGSCC
ncbi:MAG: methyltransferase domain-containing protein [Acidobacteriota bacterium]